MLTNDRYSNYQSPFSERYASKEMCRLFSDQYKFSVWRKLWIALAEAEMELGLKAITPEQIEEMRRFQDTINFDRAREFEKKFRHDVMSHVHAYGEQCPKARPIIHLGATSAYVQDNTELIQMREGMLIIFRKAGERRKHTFNPRDGLQRPAHPEFHPLPVRPADHRGQKDVPVDAGLGIRRRGT